MPKKPTVEELEKRIDELEKRLAKLEKTAVCKPAPPEKEYF